jgi:hypothetical protein
LISTTMISLVELFVTIDHLDLVTMTLNMLIALHDVSSSFVLQNEQCVLLEISICLTLIGLTITGLITLLTTLLHFVNSYGFTQYVDKDTHGRNILDLVLVDTFSLISKLSVEPPVGTSDHNTVMFTVNLTPPVPVGSNSTQSAYRNYAKADYVSLNSYLLSVDWNGIFQLVIS